MSLILALKNDGSLHSSDGETLEELTPASRFLHIRPILFLTVEHSRQVRAAGQRGYRSIRAKVIDATPGLEVEPEGGVRVRKAFPNSRYLAGGGRFTRKGWLVPLPAGLAEVRATLVWDIGPLSEDEKPRQVRHHLRLRLTGRSESPFGDVYSMDTDAWQHSGAGQKRFGELGSMPFLPYSTLDTDLINACRTVWTGEGHSPETVELHEVLELPALPTKWLWDVQGLGQTVLFTG